MGVKAMQYTFFLMPKHGNTSLPPAPAAASFFLAESSTRKHRSEAFSE